MTFRDLDDLDTIDTDLLYVFVAGPGQGEGIAVGIPGSGWVLIDGCRTERGTPPLPLAAIVSRWKAVGTDVLAMVLTHPHKDHVGGFAELVRNTDPRRVVVAGTRRPKRNLAREYRHWKQRHASSRTFQDVRVASSVLDAFDAIEIWRQKQGGRRLSAICDGGTIPVGSRRIKILARAPDRTKLAAFLKGKGLMRRLASRANNYSLVLELVFGATHIVFGGDLPTVANKKSIPTGWNAVMARYPGLAKHHGLKLPHHGSQEAFCPQLMTPSMGVPRAWWLTPFNSSELPHLQAEMGLSGLLAREPAVMMTALSASRARQVQHPPPAQLALGQLQQMTAAARSPDPMLDGATDLRLPHALGALDPVWCTAFDRQGNIAGRWRGPAAFEAVP